MFVYKCCNGSHRHVWAALYADESILESAAEITFYNRQEAKNVIEMENAADY